MRLDGWLGLGDWQAAHDELECIAPHMHAHPAVLERRFLVYTEGKRWEPALEAATELLRHRSNALPAWLSRSFLLNELGRTKEAFESLLPAFKLFPKAWLIPYALASCACLLERLPQAREFLTLAFQRGDAAEIKLAALEDPDLARLWEGPQNRPGEDKPTPVA